MKQRTVVNISRSASGLWGDGHTGTTAVEDLSAASHAMRMGSSGCNRMKSRWRRSCSTSSLCLVIPLCNPRWTLSSGIAMGSI